MSSGNDIFMLTVALTYGLPDVDFSDRPLFTETDCSACEVFIHRIQVCALRPARMGLHNKAGAMRDRSRTACIRGTQLVPVNRASDFYGISLHTVAATDIF